MNQKEFIAAVSEEAQVSKAEVKDVLDAIVNTIHLALGEGDEVTIADLGKFSVKERAARTGRNPATGEAMDIPAKTVPHFSAAKALKEAAE